MDSLLTVWAAGRFLPPSIIPPGSVMELPHGGEIERFWIAQSLLNANPDTIDLSATTTLDTSGLESLKSRKSYRMLSEYQIKYSITANDTIGEVLPVGSLVSDNGPTKFVVNETIAQIIGSIPGWGNDGTQVLIPSRPNINSGQHVDRTGRQISLYTSARIGFEASCPNFALFGRDVPYIFNEIVFKLDDDGKDTQNFIALSPNKTWRQQGDPSGQYYFNQVVIYQKNFAANTYLRRAEYRLDAGAGMLKPFIESVPIGEYPTTPTLPIVKELP